ncbi:hypothetical protein F383_17414 [Gossypium arboreum]|uniref:Uncharacterized protein n=1 Tax=Gossypium arboreum TaxID=29729 RepID=A0A0B0NPE5_GOSAR|nr:hypothetical protein F383_17414 [Gossypium arboreum]
MLQLLDSLLSLSYLGLRIIRNRITLSNCHFGYR